MGSNKIYNKLNQLISDFPIHTQIAVCLIIDSEKRYFGAIKTEHDIAFVENQGAVFEIGSISKVLTCSILSTMIESEEFALDNSVSELLGIQLHRNRDFTLGALATHTSGLPTIPFELMRRAIFKHNDNPYKNYSDKCLFAYLKTKMCLWRAGKFRYSNLGVGLLLYALSQKANLSYAELFQKTLFNPLDMPDSTINRNQVGDKLVPGRGTKGQVVPNWDMNVLVGAGGVVSSVEEIGRFLCANFNESNHMLRAQHHEHYSVNEDLSVGLGWLLLKRKLDTHQLLFHNGGTGGYSSAAALEPENKNAIIILSNISAFHPKRRLIDELAISTIAEMY